MEHRCGRSIERDDVLLVMRTSAASEMMPTVLGLLEP